MLINIEGGCIISSNQITVESATNPPQIDTIITTSTPCGASEGSITLEASGGEGILTYFLNDTLSNAGGAFNNLPTGFYTIVVQDQQGCTDSQGVEILQNEPPPVIESIEIVAPSCLGNDGAIAIQANGGFGILEYALDDIDYQLSNLFMDLTAGTYTIFVIDENSCLSTSTVELAQIDNGPQIIEVTNEPPSCLGNDGSISISATAINGGLSYSLDGINYELEGEFFGLDIETYLVTVQDDLGCTTSEEVTISTEAVLPLIESIQFDRPTCSLSDGLITVQVQAENEPVSYSLDGFNFQSSNIFDNLMEGIYTLYLRDALGCSADSTLFLLEKNCPVYLPNAFSPNGDGRNDSFQVFSNGDPSSIILSYNIYDRWGEHVYEANNFLPADYSQFWDGTFRGQKMNPGVYVYIVEIGYGDGEMLFLSEDFHLIR